jgi:hypothetical protein
MSFGFGFGSSLLSSGRSCRLANCDSNIQLLKEDFSKQKVGMEGRSDQPILASLLALSAKWKSTLFSPFYDLNEAISESSKTQRSCFRMAFPKLFVPVPDRGRMCAARASSIWRGRDIEHDALVN